MLNGTKKKRNDKSKESAFYSKRKMKERSVKNKKRLSAKPKSWNDRKSES